ncbi:MAG: oligosaccharide flippase family protein [Nanoarchaeota archaeon]
MQTGDIKKNAIYGVSWTSLEFIILALTQLINLSVLARILSPADFGIFAIGTFFTTLGNSVFAMGLGPALIQKEGEVSDYLDTAWSANLLVSVLVTLLLAGLVPLLVNNYFNETQALLPTMVLLSVILISGFNNIGMVLFLKKIRMKQVVFYHVFPKLIGVGGAIVFSFLLENFWGLVIGIIIEFTIRLILSYVMVPRRPRFHINKTKFIELYSFGGWLQLKNLFNWLTKSIDIAIVGAILDTSLLGFYNRATTLAQLPNAQITKVVNYISFPFYSSIQKDFKRLKKAAYLNNDLVLIILFPVFIIILLYGEETVRIIMGDQWLYLTSTFQLLTVAFGVQAYFASFTPLLRAIGFPKFEFVFYAIKISLMLLLLYPLTNFYGIVGSGMAIMVSTLIAGPYIFYNVQRKIKLDVKHLIISLLINIPGFIVVYYIKKLYILIEANSHFIFLLFAGISIIFHFLILYLFYRILSIGPFVSIFKTTKILKK